MKFHKIVKYILSSLTVAVLMINITMSTVASGETTQEELENKIAQLEDENKKIDSQIASISGDIDNNERIQTLYAQKLQGEREKIELINNKLYVQNAAIQDKQKEINFIESTIVMKEIEIANKDTKIKELEETNAVKLEEFGEIMRGIYMADNIDYISVLAGSTDIYDFLSRATVISNISKQTKEIMDSLLADIEHQEQLKIDINNEIMNLEHEKQQLNTEKYELEQEKLALDAEKSESEKLSQEFMSTYNEYENIIHNLEDRQDGLFYNKQLNQQEIEKYENEITELIRARQTTNEYDDNEEWRWPLDSKFHMITAFFADSYAQGYSWGVHGGLDIGNAGIGGANIYATKSGEVIVAETVYRAGVGYGKYVVIDHGGGYTSLYAHCNTLLVSVGQIVAKGEAIATVGTTGLSTGNHLHFEIRIDGVKQDPLNFVS